MLTAKEVAAALSLSESDVIQEGLRALLLREMTKAEREAAQIRERYGMLTPAELQQAIAENRIPGHPAWEDYLDWQNSLETVEAMKALLMETRSEGQAPLNETALLSEAALAEDWARPEEEEAWSSLQQV